MQYIYAADNPIFPFIVVGEGSSIAVRKVKSKKLVLAKEYHFANVDRVLSLDISTEGKFIAAANKKMVSIWKFVPDNPDPIVQFAIPDVVTLCFADRENLAMGSKNGTFVVWNWRQNRIAYKNNLGAPITNILFAKNRYIITTTDGVYVDTSIRRDHKINIYPFELYPGYFKGKVIVSPDFAYLAFLSTNLEVLLFDLKSAFKQ